MGFLKRSTPVGDLGFHHLLGGCLTIPDNVAAVRIQLTDETISFKYGFKPAETYALELVEARLESQEEITRRVTATRLLTTGIFAFALKKPGVVLHQFLHITVAGQAEIVFDTDKAGALAMQINQAARARVSA